MSSSNKKHFVLVHGVWCWEKVTPLLAAKDQALTWPMQKKMLRNARIDALLTLETDHSPFYSCPEDLSDCLVKL